MRVSAGAGTQKRIKMTFHTNFFEIVLSVMKDTHLLTFG